MRSVVTRKVERSLFYKAFFLVRAFLKADALVPKPVDLPDAEDRFVTDELRQRRDFPAMDVLEALSGMAQPGLVKDSAVIDRPINAALSLADGLQAQLPIDEEADSVSLTPIPRGQED